MEDLENSHLSPCMWVLGAQSSCPHTYHPQLTGKQLIAPSSQLKQTWTSDSQVGPRGLAKLFALASTQMWMRDKWGCSSTSPRYFFLWLLFSGPRVPRLKNGNGREDVACMVSRLPLCFWGMTQPLVREEFSIVFWEEKVNAPFSPATQDRSKL